MGSKYIYVVGGDQRQLALVHLLKRDGHKVASVALGEGEGSLNDLRNADGVILPVPMVRAGELVYSPLSEQRIRPENILEQTEPGQFFFGGQFSDGVRKLAEEKELYWRDFLESESFAVKNAVAAAEGAIQIVMEETYDTLWRREALVIGYGRIGKVLARRLADLGCRVTVAARKSSDRAWAEVWGFEKLDTNFASEELSRFDVICNTVPAVVLDDQSISRTKEQVLLLDLASLPGGLDRMAAQRWNRKAIRAGGLPGKVAPQTSAEILRDTIYEFWEEVNL